MASARPSPTARSIPTTRGVVLGCALALLVGCSPAGPTAAVAPTPQPAVLADPEPAARALADSAPSPEEEPEEELLTGSPDEFSRVGDLAPGFPEDLLPVPGDAVLLVTSVVPEGDSTIQKVALNFHTAAGVAEILELYRTALTAAGFIEVPPTSAQSELAAETTFVRGDGAELVSIGVLDVDGARTVSIGGWVGTPTEPTP